MAQSKKGNRFEGFEDFGSAPESSFNEKESKQTISVGKAKSKDPNFKKVTLYLTKELHLKMRSQTLTTDEDMSELVERIMSNYFESLDA